MSVSAPTQARPSAETAGRRAGWMPEVQGLRTLALLLVASYHVWFDRVSGGVDIFLLVSAFLMTRSLYGLLERGDPFRPVSYLVRRFARLMPLATAIAAIIVVASLFTLPLSRFGAHLEQFVASALYYENVWLQEALVDYFADGLALASPFQHYWSLAIQAQVFLLWPLIFVVIWLIRKRWDVPLRPLALGIFGTIFVAGLAWSTVLTHLDQQLAYFDLSARLWEFAAGSVLALVLPFIHLGDRVRGAMMWLGVVGAVMCGSVIPVEGTFPGVAALWPVVSAALVIVGAGAQTRFGGDRLLAHPALTRIGEYTYALYLVHWPVLIIGTSMTRTERAGVVDGAVYLALSAVLAFAAVHLVERPFARWVTGRTRPAHDAADNAAERPQPRTRIRRFPWRAALVVALLPVLTASASAYGDAYVDRHRTSALSQVNAADLSTMGPNAGDDAANIPDDWAIPSPWVTRDETGVLFGCHDHMLPEGTSDGALAFCQSNINVIDPEQAARSVYVVGNSHAMQLAQFVSETARHEGWAVRGHLQHGCQYGAYEWLDDDWRAKCLQMWQDATLDIRENRPDAVVVLASWSENASTEHELPGLTNWIADIAAEGVEVIAVRDNPRSDLDMLDCAERWGFGSDTCQWPTTLTAPNETLRASVVEAGGTYLDLNEHICPDGLCTPQIGGLVVFYDDDHVTATYMRALAYTGAAQLTGKLDWWPSELGTETA